MAHSDKISEALAVVETERERVRACKRDIEETEAQLSNLKRKMSESMASLAVAERMFAIFETQDDELSHTDQESPKRRMRLGAKKRAIYTLVSKQVSTLEQLEAHLIKVHRTDIDKRYIRDVVRDALTQGDMQGDIEHQFIFSDMGREILEKAPLPAGWDEYEAAAEMRQQARGLPSATALQTSARFYGGGNISTSSDESQLSKNLRELGDKLA